MKLFLDTGAFVAKYNKDDGHHLEAERLFNEIAEGRFGVTKLYCSDYILDEAVTTCYTRTKSRKIAIELGRAILLRERQGIRNIFTFDRDLDALGFNRIPK